jgi:hypothetical protein
MQLERSNIAGCIWVKGVDRSQDSVSVFSATFSSVYVGERIIARWVPKRLEKAKNLWCLGQAIATSKFQTVQPKHILQLELDTEQLW